MFRYIRVLLVILILGGAQLDAQEGSRFDFIHYELDNGLEVILVEDHSAPTVAVDIWYDVGSAQDPPGRSGFAHLFEHMMFEGSAHTGPFEHGTLIEAVGGALNAYTSIEQTVYYNALPSHQLPLALWLEADRMGSLRVNQENFNNQRAIVIEEFQLRIANQPYGTAILELFTRPFDYEPYRRPTIGSVEDLNAATIEEVRDFHRTYYKPNNATLVIAGDINVEETRALVEQYFGPIPRQDPPPEQPAYEATDQTEAEFITVEAPLANVPALLIAYTLPPRNHPDFAAAQLLSGVLGEGNSSRLAQRLMDTGLAAFAGTGTDGNRGPGIFIVQLIPNAGVELDQLEAIYAEELDRILQEGIPVDELEKVLNGTRSGRIVGLETAFGLAEAVQAANFYFGDPEAVFSEIDRLSQVTVEDVQRAIETYMQPQMRHVITVEAGVGTPLEVPPARMQEASEDDDALTAIHVQAQDSPPESLTVSEFTLPEITEATLSNGLETAIISRPELPIISVDLFLPGGASVIPEDKAGLASLTAEVLTRGTETRSAQDIAREIEQVGGFIAAGAGSDLLTLGIFALIEDAPLAFELLGDVALGPTFPESEIEVERQTALTDLQALLADPGALASRSFSRLIYEGHPYGRLTTAASLNSLTQADLRDYYFAELDASDALLVIAGDISVDDALALAEAHFGQIPAGDQAEREPLTDPAHGAGLQIYIVNRPGPQTSFILGNIGTDSRDPERDSLRVLNEILGGGINSRLFQEVREQQGLTYSIGSGFSFRQADGTFSVSAASDNEVVADAIREVFRQIEMIRSEAVTTAELEITIGELVGSEALSLESLQTFINRVASVKLNDDPIERIVNLPERLAGLEAEDLLVLAQTYIRPDEFIVVAVGDASVIEAPLSELGPVTVIEAE